MIWNPLAIFEKLIENSKQMMKENVEPATIVQKIIGVVA